MDELRAPLQARHGLRTARRGRIRQLCRVADERSDTGDMLLISERLAQSGSGRGADSPYDRLA